MADLTMTSQTSRDVTYADVQAANDAPASTVMTGDVSTREPRAWTAEMLKSVDSFETAMAAAESMGTVEEIGTGFELCKDKDSLLGVPMLLLQWRFTDESKGDYGAFVSIEAITQDGRKVVINDGSTGIYAQLRELTNRRLDGRVEYVRAHANALAPHGLRKSKYSNPDKFKGEATTYYLA